MFVQCIQDHLREREAIVLENERELALLRGKEIDKQKTEEQERSLKAKIEQYQNTILRLQVCIWPSFLSCAFHLCITGEFELQDENRRHSETIWEHKQQIQRLQGQIHVKCDVSVSLFFVASGRKLKGLTGCR